MPKNQEIPKVFQTFAPRIIHKELKQIAYKAWKASGGSNNEISPSIKEFNAWWGTQLNHIV